MIKYKLVPNVWTKCLDVGKSNSNVWANEANKCMDVGKSNSNVWENEANSNVWANVVISTSAITC